MRPGSTHAHRRRTSDFAVVLSRLAGASGARAATPATPACGSLTWGRISSSSSDSFVHALKKVRATWTARHSGLPLAGIGRANTRPRQHPVERARTAASRTRRRSSHGMSAHLARSAPMRHVDKQRPATVTVRTLHSPPALRERPHGGAVWTRGSRLASGPVLAAAPLATSLAAPAALFPLVKRTSFVPAQRHPSTALAGPAPGPRAATGAAPAKLGAATVVHRPTCRFSPSRRAPGRTPSAAAEPC